MRELIETPVQDVLEMNDEQVALFLARNGMSPIDMDRAFARLLAKIDTLPPYDCSELLNRPPEEWELDRVLR